MPKRKPLGNWLLETLLLAFTADTTKKNGKTKSRRAKREVDMTARAELLCTTFLPRVDAYSPGPRRCIYRLARSLEFCFSPSLFCFEPILSWANYQRPSCQLFLVFFKQPIFLTKLIFAINLSHHYPLTFHVITHRITKSFH